MAESAFARPGSMYNHHQTGMTLRDYFAAHALSAVVTRTDASTPGTIASAAYSVADAMMEERNSG